MQRISIVRCFLNTNPLPLFDLHADDPSIIRLQHRLSFKSTNSKNVALAGIEGDCRYLTQLFATLFVENKKRRIKVINSIANTRLSQQSPTTTTITLSTPCPPRAVRCLSVVEQRAHIQQQIEFWWHKYRSENRLESCEISEPDDYVLILNNDLAIVKCSHKTRINLVMPKE